METLLCATDKGLAHVVDARSGASLHTLKDCHPLARGLCAAPGFVLTAEKGKPYLHAWSWKKEQPRYRCQTPERVGCVVCTSDGAHCVGGGASGKLYLWQIASGRLLLSWDGHFKPVTALATALCDGYLISAGEDALVLAWSFADILHAAHAARVGGGLGASPTPMRTWTDHTLPVNALAVGGCGQHDLIASCSADQTMRFWRIADACRGGVHTVSLPAALTTLCLHPRHLAGYAGGVDGNLYAVPLLQPESTSTPSAAGGAGASGSTPSILSACASRSGAVRSLVASLDGTRILSCGAEAGLKIWDSRSLSLLATLQPTLSFECIVALPAAIDLGTAGAGGSATDAPSMADGSNLSDVAVPPPFVLLPLKKFADPPLEDDGGGGVEASERAMGCIPIDLRPSATSGVSAGGAAGSPVVIAGGHGNGGGHVDENELLPLLAGRGLWSASEGVGAIAPTAEEAHVGGGAAALATAETQIRLLRGQLQEMTSLNRELHEMAAHAALATDAAAAMVP